MMEHPLKSGLVLVFLIYFLFLHHATTAQVLKRGPVLLAGQLGDRRESIILETLLGCEKSRHNQPTHIISLSAFPWSCG
jgi:hypothetical protein